MRSLRSLRSVAALGLGLTPLLASAAAGTVPAFAGGGAGMTLTATMEGQDQRLLVGTTHLVTITVADTPGEADLRDIIVSLGDLDPHPLPVTCPSGVNGHLSLEPGQSLQCTATVTAEAGFHTLLAQASAQVPGGGSLERSAPLHYTGFLPPPPPPPPAPTPPDAHAALKAPPSAARPRPMLPAPAAAPAPPPTAVAADPPAGPVASEPPTAAMANPTAAPHALASAAPKHGGGLAFTGMSGPLLATVGAAALALITGGALIVRRVARR